jgi:hypothetical protein
MTFQLFSEFITELEQGLRARVALFVGTAEYTFLK